MLERIKKDEPKEYAELRTKIVTICDWEHLTRQIRWLKDFAKSAGVRAEIVIGLWERKGCEDLTTDAGKRHFKKDWEAYWWIDNL